MPKTMLIDAYHREETRVALLQGGKVEDFDFEYASRKPLRGNIYLARVTRVEPSLQAAFVEYGGNRHGFLAFGEIHPDYYQIPVADRDILRKAEALEVELAQKLAELNDDDGSDDIDPDEDELRSAAETGDTPTADEASADDAEDESADAADDSGTSAEAAAEEPAAEASSDESEASPEESAVPADYAPATAEQDVGEWHGADADLIEVTKEPVVIITDETASTDDEESSSEEEEEEEELSATTDEEEAETAEAAETVVTRYEPAEAEDEAVVSEPVAQEDEPKVAKIYEPEAQPTEQEIAAKEAQKEIQRLRARYEEAKRDRNRLLRAYKIQEVIKRRQIMLVQVVKEERGNKGAALTTYLSLAGRYGVLMPNTARGGGISRKITSQGDRKRLKKAMKDLDIAPNMGLIIRTAGAKRTKTEIKRDYDYLSRLWETIRTKTLDSVAPSLIYEEASLMKRAIRDLYDKDTENIIVHGEEGYREAKDFMKMLMPSHAKHVQQHKSQTPIFLKHRVEEQLDKMYQPVVQLKSGGYLVIQQTEALVSIDVNSGKATKERNVEQTALKTNSEAAVEVARQCKLRDLAGLIVIDFIDMEENRNNRAVEKKLKEAMKNDRARTQIGTISGFGLMEMSRQRRRSGIVDGTTQICPVCQGAGAVRSHEMAALRILRAAEGAATTGKHGLITVKASLDVALYILNTKRDWLERMEKLYKINCSVLADAGKFGDQYEIAGSGTPSESMSLKDAIGDDGPLSDLEAPELESNDEEETAVAADGDDKPKKKRRRRRRRGRGEDGAETQEASETSDDNVDAEVAEASESDGEAKADADATDEQADGEQKKRRRRGRRGGRRNRRRDDETAAANENSEQETVAEGETEATAEAGSEAEPSDAVAEPVTDEPSTETSEADAEATPVETELEAAPEVKEDASSEVETPEEEVEASTEVAAAPEPEAPAEPAKPRRGGWWQRALGK